MPSPEHQWIAERELTNKRGGLVVVRIGIPRLFPREDPYGFGCDVEVTGLPAGTLSQTVIGVDSLQALLNATVFAHDRILRSGVEVTWFDSPSLGFPVVPIEYPEAPPDR